VVATVLNSVISALLKLEILAGGVLYAGLVLMNYRTHGASYPLRIDPKDTARTAMRSLIWLGVKAVALVVRIAVPLFEMLAEASAEVGEWFLSRRAPETQAAIRSRFMR
jgi:hypothetical protein